MVTVDGSLGVLYPGYSGERDYALLAEALEVPLDLLHTAVVDDLHAEASLRSIGEPEALIAEARAGMSDAAAVLWACTSGSFVFGWKGAREQARRLSDGLGVPVTSTSLAFVSAVRALGGHRIAIAGTYPRDVTEMFVALLTEAGLEVVAATSAGVMTGTEVGRIGVDQVVDMVRPSAAVGADVILVPDTALHSFEAAPALEHEFGEGVLTANQVTMWAGVQLRDPDWSPPSRARRALGVLCDLRYEEV